MRLPELLRLTRAQGITVEVADLGECGAHELRSEYDPAEGAVRINARSISKIAPALVSDFIAFAIAHELYHHCEHRGEIVRLGERGARERAADEFARALLSEGA